MSEIALESGEGLRNVDTNIDRNPEKLFGCITGGELEDVYELPVIVRIPTFLAWDVR